MSDAMYVLVQIALLIMVLLLLPCIYRLLVGPTPSDRLQAVDLITNMLIGVIVLLAMAQGAALFIDVALALAAFSFIGTLALARYLSEGRVF